MKCMSASEGAVKKGAAAHGRRRVPGASAASTSVTEDTPNHVGSSAAHSVTNAYRFGEAGCGEICTLRPGAAPSLSKRTQQLSVIGREGRGDAHLQVRLLRAADAPAIATTPR